jgi:AmiR/NasT family two-component response regulator
MSRSLSAFGPRALTEQSTGILMERHSAGQESAFGMLHEQSRIANRTLIDLAVVVDDDGYAYSPRDPQNPEPPTP